MDEVVQFLKGFDIQNIIAILAIVWFFYHRSNEKMERLETRLKDDMQRLESRLDTRLKDDIHSLESRLKGDMNSLETRLKYDMTSLESRLTQGITEVKAAVGNLDHNQRLLDNRMAHIEGVLRSKSQMGTNT